MTDRLTQLSVSDLVEIEKRIDLMRWSECMEDEPPQPGSLYDQFWNHDVPRLVSAARVSAASINAAGESLSGGFADVGASASEEVAVDAD